METIMTEMPARWPQDSAFRNTDFIAVDDHLFDEIMDWHSEWEGNVPIEDSSPVN